MSNDHLTDAEKALDNPTFIHDKNSQGAINRGLP